MLYVIAGIHGIISIHSGKICMYLKIRGYWNLKKNITVHVTYLNGRRTMYYKITFNIVTLYKNFYP